MTVRIGGKGHLERREPGANPGDETSPGSPGTGEALCPVCAGSGRRGGERCENCEGTGRIIEGIGRA
jgi:hypothetical protein